MIDWNKYFEHIFIISRCSNFKQRELLDKELQRIGLSNYTYLYQPDSKLLDYKSSIMPETIFRCKNAHYNCCKMSYELNYNNILIFEDDIVFLKNINTIEQELIKFTQTKSDIYLFNYIPYKSAINGIEGNAYYSADCYWLNRHGMEFIIYIIEHFPNVTNDLLFIEAFSEYCSYYTNFYVNYNNEPQLILIDISEQDNILPITIKTSTNRLCVERQILEENNVYKNLEDNRDISLYNL